MMNLCIRSAWFSIRKQIIGRTVTVLLTRVCELLQAKVE